MHSCMRAIKRNIVCISSCTPAVLESFEETKNRVSNFSSKKQNRPTDNCHVLLSVCAEVWLSWVSTVQFSLVQYLRLLNFYFFDSFYWLWKYEHCYCDALFFSRWFPDFPDHTLGCCQYTLGEMFFSIRNHGSIRSPRQSVLISGVWY